ncbi:Plasmodium exported protein, unknown function [Plasmodium malariae]|uniref:Fam-m protein n=1 Tax=Plasmodium malariae TaxID=5858 RepID=A0A1D3SM46_PLAMA|nr:Plasmodium exported protein, unknown function [Plasmodium malariae]SCO92893.1 Plasmodium exported protein, unknown function [Plasmodium malariae]
MKGNIKYFILVKTTIFIIFNFIYSYIYNLCNSDEYLYDRNCECIILNSRNNRILSEDKNKTIKLGYKHKLHLNKNDYLKNKKYSAESDCSGRSVSKKKYNSKFAAKSLVKKCTSVICKPYTTIYTFFEKLLYRVFCIIYKYRKSRDPSQKKSLKRSVFISTALIFVLPVILFLTASVIYILDQFFSQTWKDLIPLNGTDNFLYYLRENAKFIALSTSILSVSMVIFILVKFLKYVIEVNKNELKS